MLVDFDASLIKFFCIYVYHFSMIYLSAIFDAFLRVSESHFEGQKGFKKSFRMGHFAHMAPKTAQRGPRATQKTSQGVSIGPQDPPR